jgi:transposase-like protein
MNSEPKRKGHTNNLNDLLQTEADARAFLESKRWPNGVVCAFEDCGGSDVTRMEIAAKTYPRAGKPDRVVPARSLFNCKACRRQFTVTKGTIFEDSKIALRTWLIVAQRMAVSKKSVSARQIEREFGVTHEAAWFMCHRIRWAMTDKNPSRLKGTIEADETYVGGKPRGHRLHRSAKMNMSERITEAWANKTPVFGIRERDGRVRARVMKKVSQQEIERTMFHHIDRENSRLMTDEHIIYNRINQLLPHDVIRHKSEYVRGEVHTQGIRIVLGDLEARADRHVPPRRRGLPEPVRAGIRLPPQHPSHKRRGTVQRALGERGRAAGLVRGKEREGGDAFLSSLGIGPACMSRCRTSSKSIPERSIGLAFGFFTSLMVS